MTDSSARRFSRLKGLALLAASACLASAAYAFSPGYLAIDIPVASHQGGGAFWRETQWSELRYADSAGKLFVHRQVGTAYPEAQGWTTPGEALAFFDVQLTSRDWRMSRSAGNDPVLPESRLLEQSLVRRYVRGDDLTSETDVHIAVWPIGGDIVKGFMSC